MEGICTCMHNIQLHHSQNHPQAHAENLLANDAYLDLLLLLLL